MTPSPVSPISPEEYAWLTGKLWYVESKAKPLVSLDRTYYPGDVPDLPLEQHSCSHGSQFVHRHEDALRGLGLAVAWRPCWGGWWRCGDE